MKRNTVLAMGLAVTMMVNVLTGCGNNETAAESLTPEKEISRLEKATPVVDKNKETSKTQKDTEQAKNTDSAAIPANVLEEGEAESMVEASAQTGLEVKPESSDTDNYGNGQNSNISDTTISAPNLSSEASSQSNLKSSNEASVQANPRLSDEAPVQANPRPSDEASVQANARPSDEAPIQANLRPSNETSVQTKTDVKSESTETNGSEKVQVNNTANTPASSSKPLTENTSGGNVWNSDSGNDNTNVSSGTKSENNNNESSVHTTAHTHSWKEHTAKRWVSSTITVEDEPAQYSERYTLYKMYWYNTDTWEETRDPSRFDAWMEDMEGGPLSPISLAKCENPEADPLFLGYDEYGHPSFTNDHAIFPEHYDLIVPAVTHEEYDGYYETYVYYYYCDCGEKK